ncbi:MAG: insulinase family protein, partial [Acidobacteria bacterium]|nr:insulinase family protein [Acidobacteriota bacterium]
HRLIGSGSVLGDGPALHRRLERLGVEMKTADEPSIPFDDRYHVPEYSYIRMEGPADALPEALQLLAESIRAPRWDARAWEEALSGHRESRRAGGRGSARVETELRASLLGATSPLARPPSGPADGEPPSEAAVRELLGTWPAGYFEPSSLVLTVASPLPAEDVLARVGDLFGGGPDAAPRRVQYEIAAAAPTPPAAKSGGPPTGGPMGPQVALGWGRIVQVGDAERPALSAALDALSDLMTAELREKAGLIYRHEAGARALPGGALMIQVGLSTRPENRDEAATRLRALLQQLGSSELPADEVARLAARGERREMLDRLAAGARAYRLGVRLFNGTTGSDAAGAPRDAARIREAARRFLAPDGLVQVGP